MKKSVSETDKATNNIDRFLGTFAGGIGGLLIGGITFAIIVLLADEPTKDRLLFTLISIGGILGSVLGLIFPRQLFAIGSILCRLIPLP